MRTSRSARRVGALVASVLLVVDSQFGEPGAGEEPGPSAVSRIPAP